MPDRKDILIRLPDGTVGKIPPEDLEKHLSWGARQIEEEEAADVAMEMAREGELEKKYGDRPGTSFALGLREGLTLGLIGPQTPGEEEILERSPRAAVAGEVTGSIAPALVPGGGVATAARAGRGTSALGRALSATPSGLAIRAGEAIASRGGGRLASKAAGYATEGALFTGVPAAAELARSDDPVTLERIASEVALPALAGAGLGAGVGVATKGLEGIVGQSKRSLDASKRGAAAAEIPLEGREAIKASRMVKAAREAGEEISPVVDDALRYYDRRRHAFSLADDAQKKVLVKNRNAMRSKFDDPLELSRSPGGLKAPVRRDREILRSLEDEGVEKIVSRTNKADREVIDDLANRINRKRTGDLSLNSIEKDLYRSLYGPAALPKRRKGKISLPRAREFVSRVREGDMESVRRRAFSELQGAREVGDALEQQVVDLTKTPGFAAKAAGRAAGLGIARRAAQAALGGHLGAYAFGPIGYLVGAVGGALGNEIGKIVSRFDDKTKKIVDALVSGTEAAAKKAPYASSRSILSGIRLAAGDIPERRRAPREAPLVRDFKDRAHEVLSHVGPDGQVTPQSRDKIADRLDGIRAVDPVLADRMETMAVTKLEFLADKVPRNPFASLAVGPDMWIPSDADMRRFSRYLRAVDDLLGIEERAAEGRASPEDYEVFRVVYPEEREDFLQRISEKLIDMEEPLPYDKRIALSLLTGTPMDPSMEPNVLQVLQGQYSVEPGTSGGQEPPMAEPAFGAIKKSVPEPTPAQQREQ